MSRIPLLTALVPRSNFTYLGLLAGGLAGIAVLDSMYIASLSLAPLTTDGMVAALDLDAEGSIASWFSIVLLFLCGFITLLIRTLRRLASDYSPREGPCWLALSVLWFTMSLDEGASLHEGFKEMMVLATGTRLMGDGSIYWAVPYFLALSAAGCFLLWFLRHTTSAVVSLLSAGGCYAFAAAAQMELVFRGIWPMQIWVEESAEMLGCLLLLVSLALYARSVVERLEQTEGQPRKVHSAHPLLAPVGSTQAATSASTELI